MAVHFSGTNTGYRVSWHCQRCPSGLVSTMSAMSPVTAEGKPTVASRAVRLTSDVKLRAALQARGHRSGGPFAANELRAASGDLQTA